MSVLGMLGRGDNVDIQGFSGQQRDGSLSRGCSISLWGVHRQGRALRGWPRQEPRMPSNGRRGVSGSCGRKGSELTHSEEGEDRVERKEE